MKVSGRQLRLPALALTAAAMIAGCPLPFEYNGPGGGNLHTSDPSTPSMTAPVMVSYSEQGGTSGTIADGGALVSGLSTTVTLSTATENAIIYYCTNGESPLTNLGSAKKMNGSSGAITITRTTSVQTLDIRAIAIGSNMLFSQAVHATVSVSPYPILSVTCDKASVSEDGGTATFTIASSSSLAADITVKLLTGGTYVPADLTGPLPASGTSFSATLVHATTTISLPITGVHDAANANPTVTLTIQPDSNTPPAYTVGAPSSASVVIRNDGTHTVTYNGNGSTGGAVPTDGNSYLPGVTVTVLGNSGSLVKTGYAFVGWNTAANGSGTTYAAGYTFVMGAANVTLYAAWTQNQVSTPQFSPGAGTYSSAQAVTISTSTTGASIRYTTDGSIPTETTGTLYTAPFSVMASETLNAIAYETGWIDSTVASATYTITLHFTNYTTASGLGSNNIGGIAISGSTIYAATTGGVSISTNGGSSWTNYTTGLGSTSVGGIAISGSTIYAATQGGLSVSTNGGSSFTNYTTANGLGGSYVYGVAVSGSTIYAATSGGLSVSTNGGSSFTNYLSGNWVNGIAVSGSTICAALFGGGVSVSANGGTSWTTYTTTNGLGGNTVRGAAISGSTIYAATNGGLSVSTDGGTSWTNYTTANGLGNNTIVSVNVSGSTIYAWTLGGGLSVSSNGGANWTTNTTTNGLGSNTGYWVAISGLTIYAATWGGVSVSQ